VQAALGETSSSPVERARITGGGALVIALVVALAPILVALIFRIGTGRALSPSWLVPAVGIEGLAMVVPMVFGIVARTRLRQPRLAAAAIVASILGNYLVLGLIVAVYFLLGAVMVSF
jgi:hypothetical protein